MPYTPSIPDLTLSQQPQALAPVNAPLWFVSTSNSNQFSLFKYVYALYSYDRFTNSPTFLGQYSLPPRPNTDLGVFDSHKILQSQVGAYTFSYNQSGLQGVSDNNSVAKYKTFYGYEYNPDYRFSDTFDYFAVSGDLVATQTFNTTSDGGFNLTPGSGGFTISSNYNVQLFFLNTFGSNAPFLENKFSFTINDGTNNQQYVFDYPTAGTLFSPYQAYIRYIPFLDNSATLPANYTIKVYSNTKIVKNILGLKFPNYSLGLFNVGDIINVYMDNQNQNGSYNGKTEIIAPVLNPATSSYLTITSYGVIPSGPETGVVNSLQRVIGSSSYVYAFPGTRQYTQNNQDFGITNAISSVASNWATNYSGPKSIYINQYETLSVMSLTASGIANSYYQVNTYDDNMNLLNTYTSTNPIGITAAYIKYELGSGTKNLQGWTMSGTPISLPLTGYYTIGITSSANGINANYTYHIVNNCSRYQNIRIQFMNRVGGYDYWNFNYDSKWTIEVKNRTIFTRGLDYNYSIGDRGRTILNIDANEMWEASTDWISESDYAYLQELITSNDVYVIDEINGYKLPINIEDTSYVQKTALRDKLFNLKITYRYAYDMNLQGS